MTCAAVLVYNPRRDRSNTRLLKAHGGTHTCKLEPGHPADGPGDVPIHECSECTLCWESEPRPTVHCTCQAARNPNCPTHGSGS